MFTTVFNKPHLPFSLLLAGLTCLSGMVSAQSVLETATERLDEADPQAQFQQKESSENVAPSLFEEEFDDIGPQYLLVSGTPKHKWFRALLDTQWLSTSNPTQAVSSSKHSVDLFVLTAQLGVVTPQRPLWGGECELLSGFRYQLFDYGTLTGDVLIDNRRISLSNFKANTWFSDLKWNRDQLKAQFGLRWTSLDNRSDGTNFYSEWSPNWSLSRDWMLATNTMLTATYAGSLLFTDSHSGGVALIGDDFNNRVANSIGLSLLHRLTPDLYLQPSARVNYAIYTDDLNGDREDTVYSLGLALSYYFSPEASVRIFSNYQKRYSNGLAIVEYSSMDLGAGISFGLKF